MQRRKFILASALAMSLAVPAVQAAAKADPEITVYRSPTCGCCLKWVEHLRKEGFTVKVVESEDVNGIKFEQGVPENMTSCHTGMVNGYFLEGHVPAREVRRLLAERPAARGIAVPGMPMGSPGMEMNGHTQAYDVFLVKKDGSNSVFAHYPK